MRVAVIGKNKVDKVVESYLLLKASTLSKFCEKQNLGVFGFMAYSEQEIICFSPDLKMAVSDIFLDIHLHIERGIAIRYMQGFDVDLEDAQINKELSYAEYLKSKKLI